MVRKSGRRFSWLKLNIQVNIAWVIVAIVILWRAAGFCALA
jgi:hypothetical protein